MQSQIIRWVTKYKWQVLLMASPLIISLVWRANPVVTFWQIVRDCQENPLKMFEWGGSLTGLAGAAVLASNTRISKYGWWLFLLANVFMIVFAKMGRHDGLLLQQVGFTLTSVLGIVRSSGVAASVKMNEARVERT